jgi:hypothetical protein
MNRENTKKRERERENEEKKREKKVNVCAIRYDTFIVHIKTSTNDFIQTKQKAVK